MTETASGGSHTVRLVKAAGFPASDAELLKEAWELFPRLPMDDLDVLVVEEMGKDVSGAGMDPNIIGFWRREGGERKPDFRCLVVLGLTEVSHGNATGMGMADLTTKAMIDSIDYQATYLNALTSRVYRSARQPIPLADDKAAIEQAFDSVAEPLKARAGRDRLHPGDRPLLGDRTSGRRAAGQTGNHRRPRTDRLAVRPEQPAGADGIRIFVMANDYVNITKKTSLGHGRGRGQQGR